MAGNHERDTGPARGSSRIPVRRQVEALMTGIMHDYVVEIQMRTQDGHPPTVKARQNILAENDPDAQRQAEEWARTVEGVHSRSICLLIRHDDRVVVDRELGKSL